MTVLWLIWAALCFVAFVVLETIALLDRRTGTTLSANVWRWRQRRWLRALLMPWVAWLLWHFLSWSDFQTWGLDDFIALAAGLAFGLVVHYRPRSGA